MEAQAVVQSRPVPTLPVKNRMQQLLQTFNIIDTVLQVPEQPDPNRIVSYQHIQRLKIPGTVHMSDTAILKKCHLPVPPVDIKQAWGGNELERFDGRFLITVNDFDENGRFYDRNDVTIQLQSHEIPVGDAPRKKPSLKQERLDRLKRGTVLSPTNIRVKALIKAQQQPLTTNTSCSTSTISRHGSRIEDTSEQPSKPGRPPRGLGRQRNDFNYKRDVNYERQPEPTTKSASFDNSAHEDDFVEQDYDDFIDSQLQRYRK